MQNLHAKRESRDGYREKEVGAFSFVGGVDSDGAAEQVGYHAAYREPQAAALCGAVEFAETVENFLFLTLRNAYSGIGDCKGNRIIRTVNDVGLCLRR